MNPFSHGFQERNRVRVGRLAECTTMRIGGAATFVEFNDRRDLPELLAAPHRWLGKGANLLVGDGGVDESVVRVDASWTRP